MRKVLAIAAILALAGGVAYANYCARDNVPAATLLFPYITVDTDAAGVPDPNGQTTITGITNVSRNAIIVHFTVWDILSNAQVDFDEILSGYDVLQINWRNFLNGRFDLFDTSEVNFTASSPLTFDPFEWGPDGRAQAGGLTTPQNRNVITTQCPNVPPYGNRSDLATTIRTLLTGVLKGYPHAGCTDPNNLRGDKIPAFGQSFSANPIIFYVTADTVSSCNLSFPNSSNYFTNYATQQNVMIGDMIWLKPGATTNYSEAMPAVAIESGNIMYTPEIPSFHFYQERANPAASTYREPLGTAFAFRYSNDAAGATSNLIFWKNLHEVTVASGTKIDDCGSYLYYAWDDDERSTSRTTQPISGLPTGGQDPNQLPFETQKVPLTTSYFDLPAATGWMLLVLPPSYPISNTALYTDPSTGTAVSNRNYYGWAAVQFTYGTYSAAIESASLANYWCFGPGNVPLGEEQVLPKFNTYDGAVNQVYR